MRRLAVVLVAAALLCCGKKEEKADSGGLGTSAANIGADTQTMKEANAAAAPVITATGDCEAIKAAAPESLRKLDELDAKLRTPAAKTSLESLRKQVKTAAEACP